MTGAGVGRLYAWLGRDLDGVEGIIMAPDRHGGVIALVSVDETRARALAQLAMLAAVARGQPARLVRFDRAEELLTLGPERIRQYPRAPRQEPR